MLFFLFEGQKVKPCANRSFSDELTAALLEIRQNGKELISSIQLFILILNYSLHQMELVLKLNKKQLKIFTDLADKLNIKHFVVNDQEEDAAMYRAIQDGDQNILEDPDLTDFENWLKE